MQAGGTVTPAAEAAFHDVLKADPGSGIARYYLAVAAMLGLAACGGSSSGGTPSAGSSSTPSSGNVPDVSASSLTPDFSAMAQLKDLASGEQRAVSLDLLGQAIRQ